MATHNPSLTLRAVAELVGGTVEGDESLLVESVGSVDEAAGDQITFADARHASALAGSRAGAAIVGAGTHAPAGMAVVRVQDVQAAVRRLLEHWAAPEDLPPPGVHPTAVVAEGAVLGRDVAVGAGAVVQPGARIGDRTVLCARSFVGRNVEIGAEAVLAEGAVIRHDCRVGSRCRIGSNSVIGYDGFGYYTAEGVHHRIPHAGNVVIEDDVEIGACTCVDRAKFGSTRIGAGTKIDNLVQVAHNVQIGPGCILAGQAGIAGSVKLGRYVVLGGHAGLRDNISLGDGAQVAAYSGVSEDVPPGAAVAGTPALPAREAFRIIQAWKRLPDLLKRVAELESRLEALEPPKDH